MATESVKIESVFKTSGTPPTYTFVEPKKYPNILLSLRTNGRCLVVEGPSGIGKTTAVEGALLQLGLTGRISKLSARNPEDVEYIEILPEVKSLGTVLVDDYHRLPHKIQSKLADYLKLLADNEASDTKIIILGINRAGDGLIEFAPDLVNRIDIVRFETEPDSKIQELIKKGEEALNISLNVVDEVVESVSGSFYLTQMLCKEICVQAGVLERSDGQRKSIHISFESVKATLWDQLGMAYRKTCEKFCSGTRIKKEGRAPYLHVLNWLANAQSWTLDLRDAMRHNTNLSGSVGQVVDKGYLRELIDKNIDIRQVLHFDQNTELLTVEDPQFLYYIRNIPWHDFARRLGFISVEFRRKYDFALSFAGQDRDIAEALFDSLTENEVAVFYDKHEQHRILAEDVEEYLRPIYQTEAQFVVVLLSRDYPTRIWTKMESNAFKNRFEDGSIIAIKFNDVTEDLFSSIHNIGRLSFDRQGDTNEQVGKLSTILLKKLADMRN
jgi:hypothetical protein